MRQIAAMPYPPAGPRIDVSQYRQCELSFSSRAGATCASSSVLRPEDPLSVRLPNVYVGLSEAAP